MFYLINNEAGFTPEAYKTKAAAIQTAASLKSYTIREDYTAAPGVVSDIEEKYDLTACDMPLIYSAYFSGDLSVFCPLWYCIAYDFGFAFYTEKISARSRAEAIREIEKRYAGMKANAKGDLVNFYVALAPVDDEEDGESDLANYLWQYDIITDSEYNTINC